MNLAHIPFAGKIEHLSAIIPERHADTRDGIKDLKPSYRLFGILDVP